MRRLILFPLLALFSMGMIVGCPTRGGGGDDDDDSASDDDDDDAMDDDDVADDDDDAADDDDDAADDDDDATDDDDAVGNPCDGIVLTLDGDGAACDQPWMEQGASLSLVDHCTSGSCSGEQSKGGVWIYPAGLRASFDALACTVSRVEVDLIDYTGNGTATAEAVSSGNVVATGANSITGSMDTIVLNGSNIDGVVTCGFETRVLEIRLY